MARIKKEDAKKINKTEDKVKNNPEKKDTKVVETEVKSVEKRKNKRELKLELRNIEDKILVEISNISSMHQSYFSKDGDPYFDFDPDEYEEITLSELREVIKKAPGYFREFDIIITKVLNEEYTVEDIMEYVSISRFYKGIDDPTDDFIRELLELDEEELRDALQSRKDNRKLIKNLACKAVYLTNSEDEEFELSMRKDKIICEFLGDRKTLFSLKYEK